MYELQINPELEKELDKLTKKNPKQVAIILKKMNQILSNPSHYKNLRAPLNHLKRVHIDKSFVLVFSVDEENKRVIFEDYDHHGRIYKV